MSQVVLDTDVLIDYLRDRPPAVSFFEDETSEPHAISAVSVTELYLGARDEDEEHSLDRFLSTFEILAMTEEVARLAGRYRRDFGQTHGTSLPDAIVAANARLIDAPLMTFNTKHFPMQIEVSEPYDRTGLG